MIFITGCQPQLIQQVHTAVCVRVNGNSKETLQEMDVLITFIGQLKCLLSIQGSSILSVLLRGFNGICYSSKKHQDKCSRILELQTNVWYMASHTSPSEKSISKMRRHATEGWKWLLNMNLLPWRNTVKWLLLEGPCNFNNLNNEEGTLKMSLMSKYLLA